eukprot:scaffold1841_cov61-Phaeocystis_antarctica.AAC.3
MSLLAEPRARSQERLRFRPLALNTRLNTRIHLPTPAYFPCRTPTPALPAGTRARARVREAAAVAPRRVCPPAIADVP